MDIGWVIMYIYIVDPKEQKLNNGKQLTFNIKKKLSDWKNSENLSIVRIDLMLEKLIGVIKQKTNNCILE